MKVASLFSGIEGFGLGLELAGIEHELVLQVEIDPYASRILEARYPETPRVADVKTVESVDCDLLTAGFPCQPSSQAGKRLAQEDPRWLWPEVARLVEASRPALVLLENVRGLLRHGMHDVIGDLEAIGYDAQWDLIPALAVGAPQLRHRVFVVAYDPARLPLGKIFKQPPPRLLWPQDPAELPSEHPDHIPRLVSKAERRRERLTCLGNAVIPQVVAAVLVQILQAVGKPSPEHGKPASLADEKMPNAGLLQGGQLSALPTCVPPQKHLKAALWPTPAASETSWSLDAISACVDVNGEPARDPHKRFYHPETGQIVQRTLDTYVKGTEAGLWPTPTATDGQGSRMPKGGTSPTGLKPDGTKAQVGLQTAARMVEQGLWPTPGVADANGGRVSSPKVRASRRRLSGAYAQRTLADAAHDAERVWPTPSVRDYKGASGAGFLERRAGSPDLVAVVQAHEAEVELWPTPAATGGSQRARSAEKLAERSAAGDFLQLADEARLREPDPKRSPSGLNPDWVEWLQGYPRGWTDLT